MWLFKLLRASSTAKGDVAIENIVKIKQCGQKVFPKCNYENWFWEEIKYSKIMKSRIQFKDGSNWVDS